MDAAKRRYRVHSTATISIVTVVEAASEEEAVELAYERPTADFCIRCTTSGIDRRWVPLDGIDGDPHMIEEIEDLEASS